MENFKWVSLIREFRSHLLLFGCHIYKSSNIPSNIFYSSICAETLRIAIASNNSNSFSSSIKPLVARMLKQGAYKEKLSNTLCKIFNKDQNDFRYVAKTAQELLTLLF